MHLYDTHAHLDGTAFAEDLQEVLLRARAVGVMDVNAIGTDAESSRRCVSLARQAGRRSRRGRHPAE